MTKFDLKTAQAVQGQGGSIVDSVGAGFGVPSCLMGLAKDVLSVLPTPVLFGMMTEMENGVSLADDVVKAVFAKLRNVFGIIEWDTEEGGFRFVSAASKLGNDTAVGGFFAALNGVAGLAAGLWDNYQLAKQQIEAIEDCIRSYRDFLKFKGDNAGDQLSQLSPEAYEDFVNTNYAIDKLAVNGAVNFITSATAQIEAIRDVIGERIANPDLEPRFKCEAAQFLSGTDLIVNCVPFPEEQISEVFRLVYGPPRSTFGQFVLSNDGIYFDSQTSGITPALVYIDQKKSLLNKADRWKFSHAPNLGGRGDSFSTEDLKLYVNTLLDYSKIDESVELQRYYDNDGFLQELIGNKNKRIYDLSSQITDLTVEGESEAIIYNYRQALVSENTVMTEQINKRKKQIELALKIPAIYGSNVTFKPGSVPVNDFSYMAGMNIAFDLQKQKALSFSQVDISGVVSPLQLSSTYSIAKQSTRHASVEHLILPDLGTGAIIYDGSSITSTDAPILPAESFITTEGLIAMYNFLDTDVELPSSVVFSSRNSYAVSSEKFAQLVATSQEEVFRPGLGVPYFQGITKQSDLTPSLASGVGTFMRLPSTKEFRDLLYNQAGATIDFWVHLPSLLSIDEGFDNGNVSSLYRLVLANENTGYAGTPSNNSEATANDLSDKVTRGLILGFTRDRRLTLGLSGSNDTDDNPATDAAFFLATTQSLSSSSIGLVNRSYFDGSVCLDDFKYHAMTKKVSEVVNGKSFDLCESKFCHVGIVFDPTRDELKIYLDSILMATSSMSVVFGTEPYRMPNLPTFKKGNSFEYSVNSMPANTVDHLKYGPKLDKFFTPWIVGGGYTDGLTNNFMGGQFGGIISGLRGYLGSLKFYSKPLSSEEILNNYKAHRGFFENIDTAYLGWEEITSS